MQAMTKIRRVTLHTPSMPKKLPPDDQTTPVSLRLPNSLLVEIDQQAKAQFRNRTSMISAILADWLKQQKTPPQKSQK